MNEFEFRNIEAARRWALRSRRPPIRILESGALELLHRRMFDRTWRWAGRFRVTQKSIGVESYRIAGELRNLVADVRTWIEHEAYPTPEIAARFHHRLVSIHPFPNGNGRHARLATDILCIERDWPIPTWGSTDLVAPSEIRKSYIQALQSADHQDYGPLTGFLASRGPEDRSNMREAARQGEPSGALTPLERLS